jgi:predicted transcriptional regulator
MALLAIITDAARETARLVDRDVRNIHQERSEVKRLGVIRSRRASGQNSKPFPTGKS